MKTCPTCGASTGDDDAFCEADGTRLATTGSGVRTAADVAPAPRVVQGDSGLGCPSCGASGSDDGDGYCARCGHRIGTARSTLPGTVPSKIGEYSVVRTHGEGDFLVLDATGSTRLLATGPKGTMTDEAGALLSGIRTSVFPTAVSQGHTLEIGHYVLLPADLDGWLPAGKIELSLPAGMRAVKSLLDATEALEEAGFTWEPRASDLYWKSSGELRAVRARGAKRLLERESLNAKVVLEALGSLLLPSPLSLSTPGLIRLLLPSYNFSTVKHLTVAEARAEVARAEATIAAAALTPEKLAAGHGAVAELCDPGLRRNHNEDATAVAQGEIRGEPFTVLVVCDGVSSSTHADQASTIASAVARDALAHYARSSDILYEGAGSALLAALRAAHIAVCSSNIEYGDGPPPGTTIVAALVFRKNLTVGWVGDSRAYWVSEQGAELCTTDHSWVNEAVARGEVTEAEAMASPLAHALTRCLGPLESGDGSFQDVDPSVRTKALPGPGHLILCTDGLWNYFPTAAAVAALVRGAGAHASPAAVARFLVSRALAQGGGDNVSVAVLAYG